MAGQLHVDCGRRRLRLAASVVSSPRSWHQVTASLIFWLSLKTKQDQAKHTLPGGALRADDLLAVGGVATAFAGLTGFGSFFVGSADLKY
jgi:hypothetical protein